MEKLVIESTRRIDPAINRRFRMVADAFNALVDELNGQKVDTPAVEAETVTADSAETIVENAASDEDMAIRAQARAAGISSWHVKGIDRLKEELIELAEAEEANED